MNARILLSFRVSTLCRFLAVGSLVASFGLVGCGTKATATDDATVTEQDGSTDDLGTSDADRDGDDATDTTDHTDTTDQADGHGDADGSTEQGDAPDAIDTGSDVAVDVDTSKPDIPMPPICPEAKGSCALCTLCPAFPVCTLKEVGKPDLKTYPNDCAAMCALNAINWPSEVGTQLWASECPACPLCTPTDMKTASPYCVTLNSGAKVTVEHQCEIGCLPDAKMQVDGKTPVASKGACKAKCTDPVSSGGAGCKVKGQPICAQQDNSTYTNQCQMENCDIAGCYPDGATAKTAACAPGSMTKECDGACYDAKKTPSCPATCSPVCGISKKKLLNGQTLTIGTSFRSACIAAAEGATVGDCAGISNSSADACAGGVLYTAKGCCENVDYGIIHPVCASQTVAGKPDQYVTFQNQGEYDCLTAGTSTWTFQYASACVGSCSGNYQPVCGADGFTYQNACQADYYNPPAGTFTYTNGPCTP